MKKIFNSIYTDLKNIPDNQDLEFYIEAFGGYYGIMEQAGIQAYVSGAFRSQLAFVEIQATPEDVRMRFPKQYGDLDRELIGLDCWCNKVVGMAFGATVNDVKCWAENQDYLECFTEKESGDIYKICVSAGLFVLIFKFRDTKLDALYVYDSKIVMESDESVDFNKRPKTPVELFNYLS
jgi:hypothetical protein